MSHFERAVAAELIKQSTHDGKLDLTDLRSNIVRKIEEIHTHDPHYKDTLGDRAAWREEDVLRMNVAVREVLGIIPPSKWDHSGSNAIANGLDWLGSFREHYETGLIIHTPHNEPVGQIDPNKSLASQGITFTVAPTPSGPRR